MKKYFVLFLIIISLLVTGCATIGERHTRLGRHYWNRQDPIVEDNIELDDIAKSIKVAGYVKVAVIGDYKETMDDVKEILNNLGFRIAQENYEGWVDYLIKAERMDVVHKNSGFYGGYSYSDSKSLVAEVKLTVFNNKDGTERYYSDEGDYRYAKYYAGFFHYSSWYELSPGRMAAKIAALKAVANFLDGERIDCHVLKKK